VQQRFVDVGLAVRVDRVVRERHGFGDPQERPRMQFSGQCGAQRMIHHRYTTLFGSTRRAGRPRDRRAASGDTAGVFSLWQTRCDNKNA
jgi:hypothetical protein